MLSTSSLSGRQEGGCQVRSPAHHPLRAAGPAAILRPQRPQPMAAGRGRAFSAAPAAGGLEIEAVEGIRPEVDDAIAAALDHCLTATDLGIGKQYVVSCPSWDWRGHISACQQVCSGV